MRALLAVIEGLTASFRYPHYVYGRQPSFGVPTPTAVYGLLAAASGDWFDPRDLVFACHFRSDGRFDDLEHLHVVSVGSGRPRPGYPWPVNLEGDVTPLRREMLAFPRMELALAVAKSAGYGGYADKRLDVLHEALREPRFAISFGRSQDLATVVDVRFAELEPVREARLRPGLYPAAARAYLRDGYLQTMPVTMSRPDRTRVEWDRFIELDVAAHVLCDDKDTLWAEVDRDPDKLPTAFVFMPLSGRVTGGGADDTP